MRNSKPYFTDIGEQNGNGSMNSLQIIPN